MTAQNQGIGLERFDPAAQQRRRQPTQVLGPGYDIDQLALVPERTNCPRNGGLVLVTPSSPDNGYTQDNLEW